MKKLLVGGATVVVALAIGYAFPARESYQALHLEQPLRVLFVGDIMLDRNVARSAEAEGAAALISTSTLRLFSDADLRVANWEGTVTNNPSLAQRDHMVLRFTFDGVVAEHILRLLRLDAVSLANNHALDFGEFGYDETKERLNNFGVATFGQPFNDRGTLSTVVTAQGKTICLVGFHSLFSADYTGALAEITRLRPECWRVVVFAHWGEEYVPIANKAQTESAHAFIDAGADLVVGAHPHVVQNAEIYRGKVIFYSLGNFLFDQNFSWETTHSLALRADFYEDSTAFFLTPLTIAEQHSSLASGSDRERILRAVWPGLPAGKQVAEFRLP